MTDDLRGRARLLGSPVFEIDEHPYEPPATKASALLLYLATRSDWVLRDELLVVFYSEDREGSARSNLRQLLKSIRKLGYAVGVEVEAHRVRWRIATDLQAFREAVARDRLWDAVHTYRGVFLQGFEIRGAPEFDDWLAATRQEIRSLWRQATLALAERLVERERLADAVEQLARVRQADPLDEGILSRYMDLLALSGRHSEALDEFRTFADTLERELGMEPEASTIRIVERIRALDVREPDSVVASTDRASRRPQGARAKHNLPPDKTTFIGRQAECAQIARLLAVPSNRLVTITGTGGVGKTRLALTVAAGELGRYEDGVWFVRLESATSPAEVVLKIADVVGCVLSGRDPPELQLFAHLRDWHALLVLDNFEHVLAAAPTIADLLSACNRIELLVTSRAVLNTSGERRFRTLPLAVPDPAAVGAAWSDFDAVKLFVDRAQGVYDAFRVTPENVRWITAICVRLDGLPLAIELAAARMNTVGPEALLAKLDARLPILTGGARDASPRHQTLRQTIEWSYLLLDPNEQTAFRSLAAFRGGFTLAAAEGIAPLESSEATMDVVGALVDQSLLVREPGPRSETRFAMLEAIREYALDALQQHGERSAMRSRHLAYYTRTAEAHAGSIWTLEDVEEHLRWFEAERENWRAALEWGLESERDMAVRLALALAAFWKHRPELEGARWLATVIDLDGIPTGAMSRLLLASGLLADLCLGDIDTGRTQLERSLQLARDAGDLPTALQAIPSLILVALQTGDTARGSQLAGEGVALARHLNDPPTLAHLLNRAGVVAMAAGRRSEAVAMFEECRAVARSCGRKDHEVWPLYYLAGMALLDGNVQAAKTTLAGIGQTRAEDITIDSVHALETFARVLIEEGEHARAGAILSQILRFYRASGVKSCLAHIVDAVARLALARSEPRTAAVLTGAAQGLIDTLSVVLLPLERAQFEETRARVAGCVSPESLTGAGEQGRALGVHQVCDHALAVVEDLGSRASR